MEARFEHANRVDLLFFLSVISITNNSDIDKHNYANMQEIIRRRSEYYTRMTLLLSLFAITNQVGLGGEPSLQVTLNP